MNPFARINLSSAALRMGILVSSLARERIFLFLGIDLCGDYVV